MDRTAVEMFTSSPAFHKDKQVESILAQMANLLKNLKTYEPDHPVIERSFNLLSQGLLSFLQENESLTLLVREDALVYGNVAVYECDDRLDSLAFVFYRDGIRLISFLDDLTQEDLWKFLEALSEARAADPYEADLVTILWEKDISGLRYKAVEAYLEDEEDKTIRDLASACPDDLAASSSQGDVVLGPSFFINELGLSPRGSTGGASRGRVVTESESGSVVREIFQEDDHSLMKRCSEICLELAETAESDEVFNGIVGFLGRICDWLVDWGDLISASSVLSELRAIVEKEDDMSSRRATVVDTIAKLGEVKRVERVAAYLADPGETRLDEVFAYLAMMEPVAVRPVFEILADCEVRDVRYMLCRALSIVARHEPDRLRLYLLDRRWYVVRNAVTILGLIGSGEAIPSLGLTCKHDEPRVRREVARAIGRIGDPAGLAVLADLANDAQEAVRLEALRAIGKIGITHTRALMEDCIKDKAFEKRSHDEKEEIFKIYGSAGDACLDLLQAVARGDLQKSSERTRAAAIRGIAAAGTKQASGVLMGLKERLDGTLKSVAEETLTTTGDGQGWNTTDER